jgi:hypothetical protein
MREAGDSDYRGAVEIAVANGLPSKICGPTSRDFLQISLH